MNNIKLLTFKSRPQLFYIYGIQSILRYVYLFFLLLAVISAGRVAYAQERSGGDVEILARDALEQAVATQDELRHLKDSINAITNNYEDGSKKRLESAKELSLRASELIKKQQYDEASIYFKLAFQINPTIPYLKDYTSSIYKIIKVYEDSRNYADALLALSTLKNFILNNIYTLDIKDTDKAISELKSIEDKKIEIKKLGENKQKEEDELSLRATVDEAIFLLGNQIPPSLDDKVKLLKKYEVITTTILKLSINNRNNETDKILKQLADSIKNIQYSIEVDRLLNRGYELLKAVNNNKLSPFTQQLISESALIGQRLTILQPIVFDKQKDNISIFFEEFLKVTGAVSDLNSSKEYDKLKGKLEILKRTLIKNKTKAKDAIDELLKLQDEIVVQSSSIQDKAYLIKARVLISELNRELADWQDLQINRYERWATDNIKKFHDTYKNEMGVLGSSRAVKHKIYLGLQDYLCGIDTRFLTPSGSRIYTEVFDFFYKELDREQRLELSQKFMECTKKSLNEF